MADVRILRPRSSRGRVLDQVELVVPRTAGEIAEIRSFRATTYLDRSALVVDDDLAVDERSYLFGLRSDAGLVACAPGLVLPDLDAGISRFGPVGDIDGIGDGDGVAEVGRLAVARGGSALLMLAIFGLGARWLIEHSDLDRYVAYCRPRLVRAYERVGATDLGFERTMPGTDVIYRFVAGRFDVAAERSAELLDGVLVVDTAAAFGVAPETIRRSA